MTKCFRRVSTSVMVPVIFLVFSFACSYADKDNRTPAVDDAKSGTKHIEAAQTLEDPAGVLGEGDVSEDDTGSQTLAGQFVAVGAANRIATSLDGITWTDINPFDQAEVDKGAIHGLNDVCVGEDHDVLAVGGGGGTIGNVVQLLGYARHSRDSGRTWADVTTPNFTNTYFGHCFSLASNKGVFMLQIGKALGTLFQDDVYTPSGNVLGGFTIDGCTIGNAYAISTESGIVAVGDCGYRGFSKDAVTWTAQTGGASQGRLQAVAYGNKTFVAGGAIDTKGVRLLRSDDGKTWGDEFKVAGLEPVTRVFFANDKFYAVSMKSIFVSADGKNWEQKAFPGNLSFMAYGNGRFAAWASSTGGITFYNSTDLVTWQASQVGADSRAIKSLVWSP